MSRSADGPAPSGPWLVLWDIDGTLLLDASSSHASTMVRALAEVHGLDAARLRGVPSRAGMTDGQIGRELLMAAGLPTSAIDEHAATVRDRSCDAYRPEDLTANVNPGVVDVLAGLDQRDDVVQSLVTGNYEPIARRKLSAAGLDRWFDPRWGGGFGSDFEDRERLPSLARARAGAALRPGGAPWPPARTVIVGDTPRDIACARHDGVAVVAIGTGPYAAEDLAAADRVVGAASELGPALRELTAG